MVKAQGTHVDCCAGRVIAYDMLYRDNIDHLKVSPDLCQN